MSAKSKEVRFYAKYEKANNGDNIGIYDTEEEALEQDEDWVVLDGVLYSKRWEAYEKKETRHKNG